MNNILVFTHLLNGALMVAIPVVLGIFLSRRFNLGWRLWWIGGATFILSQVGHIPFNILVGQLFNTGVLPAPPQQYTLLFQSIFLGLSAGFWEEGARYAAYRWWAKDARSWSRGLMMGAGHGGIEAIVLGILVLVTYIAMIAIRNMDLSSLVPPEQLALAQTQVSAYWSAAWYDTLLGALERSFSITVQLALSILVLQVFTRRRHYWLWIAIGWHTLVDAVAVYSAATLGIYVTELIIAVFALASLAFIFLLRQPEPEQIVELEPVPIQAPDSTILSGQVFPTVTDEKLDESRFQ